MILTTVKTGAGDTPHDPAADRLPVVIDGAGLITTSRQAGVDVRPYIHHAEGHPHHLHAVAMTVRRADAEVAVRLRHHLAHVLHQHRWHLLGLDLDPVRGPILVARATLEWERPVERDQSRRPEVKGVAVEKIGTGHHLHILEAMLMITKAKIVSPRASATVAVAVAAVTAVVATVAVAVVLAATAGLEAPRSPEVVASHLAAAVAAVAVAVEPVAVVFHALDHGHGPIHVLA